MLHGRVVRSYLPGSDDDGTADPDEPTDGLPGDGDAADRVEERFGEGPPSKAET